ncbi:MAG: hypothetical protein SOZ83_01235 [Sphaerochaetaceae bacterium]|nr:hypothetical protein [Sphaerochaetaceae bacterium]
MSEDKFNHFKHNYWYNYLNLEKKVIDFEKYLSFESANLDAFSIEILELILLICSEIEIIGSHYKISTLSNNIKSPPDCFLQKSEVEIRSCYSSTKLSFSPFAVEQKSKNKYMPPEWWSDGYNKNKHSRINFEFAKLKYLLNALCALFALEKYTMMKLAENEQWLFSGLFDTIDFNPYESKLCRFSMINEEDYYDQLWNFYKNLEISN